MSKSNRKKHILHIVFSVLLLTLYIPSDKTFCASLSSSSPKILVQEIKRKVQLAKSFLSPALPQYVTTFLACLPTPVELHFHGIQLNKIPRILLPGMLRDHVLHGKLDLDIETQKNSSGNLSIKLILNTTGTQSEDSFFLKRLSLQMDLILSGTTPKITGTCTGTTEGLRLLLPVKFGNAIKLKIKNCVFHGSIRDRKLFLQEQLTGISSSEIKTDQFSLENISIKTLTISSQILKLRGLKTTVNGQVISVDSLSFDTAAFKVAARGRIHLKDLGTPPAFPLINTIHGNVVFQTHATLKNDNTPFLAAKLSSPNLQISTTDIPLKLNRLTCEFSLKGNTFLSSLNFLAFGKIPVQASFHTRDFLHASDASNWAIKVGPTEIKNSTLFLSRFYPGIRSFEKSTGQIAVQVKGNLRSNFLIAEGKTTFHGNLENPSIPFSLKDINCKIPIHLRIPLKTLDKNVAEKSPLSCRTNTLTIGKGRIGLADFKHLSARIAISGTKFFISDLIFLSFKGKTQGSGEFQFITPLKWHFILKAKGLSLHTICEGITGFKDGLSGKVNATLTLYGNGATLETMNGILKMKAVPSDDEPLRISQKFIKKLTGRKGHFFFFQKYRPYDKGVINAAIKKGILIFDTLEVSHKILGFKDLSISVSKLGNKIALDTFIWEILQLSKQSVSTPNVTVK
jgi:hypothetical protein